MPQPTSKAIFLLKVAALYSVGNLTDHDTNPNAWTKPSMSSSVCGALDGMLRQLEHDGVLTSAERQRFYDDFEG